MSSIVSDVTPRELPLLTLHEEAAASCPGSPQPSQRLKSGSYAMSTGVSGAVSLSGRFPACSDDFMISGRPNDPESFSVCFYGSVDIPVVMCAAVWAVPSPYAELFHRWVLLSADGA